MWKKRIWLHIHVYSLPPNRFTWNDSQFNLTLHCDQSNEILTNTPLTNQNHSLILEEISRGYLIEFFIQNRNEKNNSVKRISFHVQVSSQLDKNLSAKTDFFWNYLKEKFQLEKDHFLFALEINLQKSLLHRIFFPDKRNENDHHTSIGRTSIIELYR